MNGNIKEKIIFYIMIIAVVTVAWFVFVEEVSASAVKSNNDMIKECLIAHDYDYSLPAQERLDSFDWNAAADCVSGFVVEKHKAKLAEYRELVKEKPWLKGPNWRWELHSEYECSKTNHPEKGWITVCKKPYYLQ